MSVRLQILQTIFTGMGLISLVLLWMQIRQLNRWNRLKAEHTFYSDKSRDLSVQVRLRRYFLNGFDPCTLKAPRGLMRAFGNASGFTTFADFPPGHRLSYTFRLPKSSPLRITSAHSHRSYRRITKSLR